MAKKETKSARLLALLLALIMIGSVFAMLPRGNKPVQRDVKYEFEGFEEWLKCLPSAPDQIIFVNTTTHDDELREYINEIVTKNWNRYIFANLGLDNPVEKMLVASYFDGLLYMIDVNKTRVFYTGQKEDYKGFKVKYSDGVMLVSEVSPFLIGSAPSIASAIDTILFQRENTHTLVSNYTSRLPDNFNIIFMFYGDYANRLISGGNFSDYIDFYLEGVKKNNTKYEKVVAIHFKNTGGFANYSVNDNITEYYNFINYDDGLSVAVMQDGNFTKLLNAQPRLQPIISIESVE